MAASTLLSKVARARSVVLAQLSEQGFDTSDYQGSSVEEVNAMLEARQLDMLLDTGERKVYVKFHIDKTLRPQALFETVEDLFELEGVLGPNDALVIVTGDNPNQTILKVVGTLWSQSKMFITILGLGQLQYNVLEHNLVPKHERLVGDGLLEFMARYRTDSRRQLPEISRTDPVAMAIGLRPGEVCKITRPSRTAVRSHFYRICSV